MTDEEKQITLPGILEKMEQASPPAVEPEPPKDSPAAELAPGNSQAGEIGVSSEGKPEPTDTVAGSQGEVPAEGCVFCLGDMQGEFPERHAPCCKFFKQWKAKNPEAQDPPVMKFGICSGCSDSTWINPAGFCLRCEKGEEGKPENQPKKKRGRKGKGAAAGADA